jgi:protein-S-isoprenylcysteine O-methyltransferase Ste14
MSGWRQLRAIGPLPATVTVAIPAILVLIYGADIGWGLPAPASLAPPLVGAALIVAGLGLAYRTISLFATVGQGTLAPWDPTHRLVVLGPYRHVRNPMISGVGCVLLGEAALLGSPPVLVEFVIFATANAVFIPRFEEPGLVRRFGDDYLEYRRAVPRWIPRRSPWTPGG